MRRFLCLAALLSGIALHHAGGGRAADVAGTSPLPRPEALIEKLGDRNFRVREAAGRALEARGEEVLPALRKAATGTEPEIRRRAEVLADRLERNLLLSPKRVTLVHEKALVKDVIADLAKQTDYRIEWQGNEQMRVSLNLPNGTYWQALERLMTETGCGVNVDDQNGVVSLYEHEGYSPYAVHTGPFRVQAMSFNYNRFVNLMHMPRVGIDPNQHNDNLSFSFMIQCEPRAPLVNIGQPQLTEARDENDQSLLARNQNDNELRFYDPGIFRSFQFQTQVAMHKPNRDAAKARLIKGKLPVVLLASQRPEITIEKVASIKKKQTFTGANVELEVRDVNEQNKTYTMSITFKKLGRVQEQDPNWVNSVWQRLDLVDAKGRRYQPQVTGFTNTTPTLVDAHFQFTPPGADVGPATKLVFNQWLTIPHEVEFEFRDVPLP